MQDTKTVEKFIQLRAEGNSLDTCSKKLHKAKGTLLDIEEEYKEEISRQRAFEIQRLLEMYNFAKCKRVEFLCKTLDKVNKELMERDLKDLKTEKLCELSMKYNSLILEQIEDVYYFTGEGGVMYNNQLWIKEN